MRIPSSLVPRCPHCGRPLTMNLRADDKFVEDDGWHTAAGRYSDFLHCHENTAMSSKSNLSALTGTLTLL